MGLEDAEGDANAYYWYEQCNERLDISEEEHPHSTENLDDAPQPCSGKALEPGTKNLATAGGRIGECHLF
jgi:hypothetical protein